MTVFAYVETLGLLFRRDTDTDSGLQDTEYDDREDEGSKAYGKCADELRHEDSTAKDTDGKRAPDTNNAMNGDRPNRIINLDFVKEDDKFLVRCI